MGVLRVAHRHFFPSEAVVLVPVAVTPVVAVVTIPPPFQFLVGVPQFALAMRDLARELELPCLEIPPLARSVYFTTRENQVIREELYGAVASVLAFVLALGRGEKPVLPTIAVVSPGPAVNEMSRRTGASAPG